MGHWIVPSFMQSILRMPAKQRAPSAGEKNRNWSVRAHARTCLHIRDMVLHVLRTVITIVLSPSWSPRRTMTLHSARLFTHLPLSLHEWWDDLPMSLARSRIVNPPVIPLLTDIEGVVIPSLHSVVNEEQVMMIVTMHRWLMCIQSFAWSETYIVLYGRKKEFTQFYWEKAIHSKVYWSSLWNYILIWVGIVFHKGLH